MKRLPNSLVLLLTAVLAICGFTTLRAADSVRAPAGIDGVEWLLATLDGKPTAAGKRGAPTVRFDAGKKQISGFAGINRYFGGYEREGDRLKFGPLGSTQMGGPPEAMALENAFLAALASTSQWKLDGATLNLLHDGKVLASFNPNPAPA